MRGLVARECRLILELCLSKSDSIRSRPNIGTLSADLIQFIRLRLSVGFASSLELEFCVKKSVVLLGFWVALRESGGGGGRRSEASGDGAGRERRRARDSERARERERESGQAGGRTRCLTGWLVGLAEKQEVERGLQAARAATSWTRSRWPESPAAALCERLHKQTRQRCSAFAHQRRRSCCHCHCSRRRRRRSESTARRMQAQLPPHSPPGWRTKRPSYKIPNGAGLSEAASGIRRLRKLELAGSPTGATSGFRVASLAVSDDERNILEWSSLIWSNPGGYEISDTFGGTLRTGAVQ